jgi:hypothetical protein
MTDAAQTIEAPAVEVTSPEAPATRLADNPEVVSAVQAHLDAFADDLPATPAEKPVAETPAASPAEETPGEEKPVEAAPATETPAAEAAPAPVVESTLPAAYVRTAKARGWTDEEIAGFAKSQPDLAMKTFERMHASRTQEISEWADLGRKVRQAPVSSAGTPPPGSVTPVASPSVPASLQPIDVKAMVEKFGNQELIEALAGPVNAAIAAVAPLMQEAASARQTATQAAKEALGKTIQDFFTSKDMKPFETVYGTAINALTAEQVTMRDKVLEMADALIAGASHQGRRLSVDDALTMAHDSVASGIKDTAIREQIRKNVSKRERQITMRPTAQGRAAVGGPPKTRTELIGRTEDRLAAAFS